MMLYMLVLAMCALPAVAMGQPIGCDTDEQCSDGHFCMTDVQHCSPCLRCEDLHRHQPLTPVRCVRSFSMCGDCLKGFVESGTKCVAPPVPGEGAVWYVWVLGALLVALLLLCAAGVLVYTLKYTDTFRVFASTRTSVEAPGGKPASPTAPQPPPYNYAAPYEPVRSASPGDSAPSPPNAAGDYYRPTTDTDPGAPLVKRLGPGSGGRAAREAAGSQNARVFTNPAYVRNVPPPSYDSTFSDDSDHETSPFEPQDEDTMPSPWTPAAHNNAEAEGAVAASGSSAGASVPARRPARSEVASPPPNKMRCLEDSNNNGGGSSGTPPPAPPSTAAPPAAPSVVINVLNVNAMHQRNDLSL